MRNYIFLKILRYEVNMFNMRYIDCQRKEHPWDMRHVLVAPQNYESPLFIDFCYVWSSSMSKHISVVYSLQICQNKTNTKDIKPTFNRISDKTKQIKFKTSKGFKEI